MIEWILPLEVQSPNIQEHWTKRHKRNKKNARLIQYQWLMEDERPKPPCTVSLQRLYHPSRGKKYDSDNIVTAFKYIRDTLAGLILPGLAPGRADDSDLGISFAYEQMTSLQKGVRILIIEQWEIEQAAQDLLESKE